MTSENRNDGEIIQAAKDSNGRVYRQVAILRTDNETHNLPLESLRNENELLRMKLQESYNNNNYRVEIKKIISELMDKLETL